MIFSLGILILVSLHVYFYLQGGLVRYLSLCSACLISVMTSITILSFLSFCWLFLENQPSLNLFFEIIAMNDNHLWQLFLKVQAIGLALEGLAALYFLYEKLRPGNKVFGNAHFANAFEMHRAGIFKQEEQSIIIGKKHGRTLYANGFEHVLVFAPTGSGKTRSIGIPNMLNYPYSVVCNDVKLTLYKTTAEYREKTLGNKCFCFAPTKEDGITHKFNPLSLISEDKRLRITDLQRIAHILMPDNKKSDPIWQQASRKLFKVIVLYLLDSKDRPTTLGEINRLVKQPSFDNWLQTEVEDTDHLDPEFYRNAHSYLNNHEKTRSSILETFSGYFELFDDPLIDAATSSSDFDLRNLRREKITIYVGFSDDDMERLAPLLTLFWQQLISAMIKEVPNVEKEPYPLLCLIDEFSSLGRIERLRRSLKLLREYRVRCILMLQYIAQTYEQYTHDEAKAFTNIKTKIAFAPEDLADAEYVSKLLGMRTKKVCSGSTGQQMQGQTTSISYQYQAVPLMRPEEVMKIPKNKNLIMRTGYAAVKAYQFSNLNY